MSILIDQSTRLIVQGITGRDGLFHALRMKEYGTCVVGGTTPGKGGSKIDTLPVFNTMYEAVQETKANTSIIFVPARFAADAIMEAADAGIALIIWSQLSGNHLSGKEFDGYSAGKNIQARKHWCHQSQWNLDLRDCVSINNTWNGTVDRYRCRWRSCCWALFY